MENPGPECPSGFSISQIGRKSRALGTAAPTAPRRTLLPTLTVLTTFFRSSHLTQSRPMVLVCVEAPCWCGHCREAYNLDGVLFRLSSQSSACAHVSGCGVAEHAPAEAHPFVPVCINTFLLHVSIQPDRLVQDIQQNLRRLCCSHLPVAGPPEVYPGVRPHTAPLVDLPSAANGLKTCWSFPEQLWHARQHASD